MELKNFLMINIDTLFDAKLFSICSLVTDKQEYDQMRTSFHSAGFTEENSEFLYADNSNGNTYDGYQGVKAFLTKATGTYIIICHQDVLLSYDTIDTLMQCIEELGRLDKNWAIAGNAGYNGLTQRAIRISDPYEMNASKGNFPARVQSLDENFLLIRRNANLSISNDLTGFHFYGVDLCILANILGYNAYVINFHLYHKSGGNCNESFFTAKSRLISKYQKALATKVIRTTCSPLFLSSSKCLNLLCNKKIMISLQKRVEKLRAKFF
jgi:GT2 family glycosyltransferase